MQLKPEEISKIIRAQIKHYENAIEQSETGTVIMVGDGIARASGLEKCMAGELLQFDNGEYGMAQNLEENTVSIVLLGSDVGIKEGSTVKRTGKVVSVPVGDAMIGRVVNALGQPIDGAGPIETTEFRAIESRAPGIIDRQPVKEPLQTGIKAIDSQTPIGRGQRQLIIGDRKTGKTAIAVDTIINQKANWETGDPTKQVRCIYVAVGQKNTTVAEVHENLRKAGAMEYTVIVNAPASDPAGFKYIAPYSGSAIGQHWMYGEQGGFRHEFIQPAICDGQQIELVQVGVVEAPAPAQVTQEPVADDETHGALGILAGQPHQFGGAQVFGQGAEIGLVEPQCFKDSVGQGFFIQHALVVLQRANQCRAQREQKHEVVEVPSLQGRILAVVGKPQQFAWVWLIGGYILGCEQLPDGAEREDGGGRRAPLA